MSTFVSIRTFLRLLGFVYAIAFVSLGIQAAGLIGSHGILPYAEYLNAMRRQVGPVAYWYAPSVLWLYPGDGALAAVWIAGALLGLAATAGYRQRAALAGCLVLWLSLCAVGQDFLSFQWDILLSEAGFLAIFADATPVRVFLFRWLLFRLMFFSGVVKLASGDPNWRNLTALSYHYETQPLPTPMAWYAFQLPMGFQKASTFLMFVVELAVPFLFFAPRRWRHAGACATITFQVLILLTGNYTFFNWLTIALTLFLFLDWQRPVDESRLHRVVTACVAAVVGTLSLLLVLELFSIPVPGVAAALVRDASPLRIVNSYGLFAVMTTTRPEIVVEGSNDGDFWKAYEFRYKIQDLDRAPPIVAPHQPRLDWQMWFAALGTYQENQWFVSFMLRLLHGEPAVLRLLRSDPFAGRPPKYVRARLYLYHFTHFGERPWWTREEKGLYFPPVSLK